MYVYGTSISLVGNGYACNVSMCVYTCMHNPPTSNRYNADADAHGHMYLHTYLPSRLFHTPNRCRIQLCYFFKTKTKNKKNIRSNDDDEWHDEKKVNDQIDARWWWWGKLCLDGEMELFPLPKRERETLCAMLGISRRPSARKVSSSNDVSTETMIPPVAHPIFHVCVSVSTHPHT